jgi:hypothetical protein
MPPAIAYETKQGPWDKIKRQLQDEYQNQAKFTANLRLLKAIAIFTAGVVVARNFGEALFVQ